MPKNKVFGQAGGADQRYWGKYSKKQIQVSHLLQKLDEEIQRYTREYKK